MSRPNVIGAVGAVAFAAALVAAAALPAVAAPARARLAQAAGAAATERAAEQALGASFAGAWFEPASARLVVATTDPASFGQLRALGAAPRLVARNAATLDAQQAALDARAAGVSDSVTGWYVDPASNSVVVSATDPAAARTFAGGTGEVRVEQVTQAPRPLADLVGGEAIYARNGVQCSVGFNATSGSTRYVITSGHCTDLGGTWTGYNRSVIGPVTASSFPDNDYGLIQVTSSSWLQTPFVSDYSGGRVTVTGSSEAVVGSSVCRSGPATGYRCGTIEAKDQTVNYGGGDIVYGLTRTSTCAEPGDSGSSYVTGSQAQGVLSGGVGDCLLGGETFFQPVNEILSAYGVNLVTG